MISLRRTTTSDIDFKSLVKLLDAELAIRDGDDHEFYNQFNKLDSIPYVVVVYNESTPIGCGALKNYNKNTAEIKRMFTLDSFRGKGIATKILSALETWAMELGYDYCILETGIRQPEAIALYQKCGYQQIENYGQYENVTESLCFKKRLNKFSR
ncbi:GNAT family N-acetyltransferase [Jejudonia soesokkakensis]|uniref:GNAT family N-acetyltransferase n=1 Tax=Jejudonia soesokkakensis TaxID=1323432 RepID=A0ABW2MVG7_9FLAO